MRQILFLVIICLLTTREIEAKKLFSNKPTVHTVMDKIMNRYDPHNNWHKSQISYKVNIIDQNGHLCSAEVETWGPTDFFQISIKTDGQQIVKRYEYGEYFASLNRSTDFSDISNVEYGLNMEKIDQCMDLFRLINGSVMEMERAGMKAASRLKTTNFEDRSCYVLYFRNRNKDSDNAFCTGKIKLYVDEELKNKRT